jgi:hypothetical protein
MSKKLAIVLAAAVLGGASARAVRAADDVAAEVEGMAQDVKGAVTPAQGMKALAAAAESIEKLVKDPHPLPREIAEAVTRTKEELAIALARPANAPAVHKMEKALDDARVQAHLNGVRFGYSVLKIAGEARFDRCTHDFSLVEFIGKNIKEHLDALKADSARLNGAQRSMCDKMRADLPRLVNEALLCTQNNENDDPAVDALKRKKLNIPTQRF